MGCDFKKSVSKFSEKIIQLIDPTIFSANMIIHEIDASCRMFRTFKAMDGLSEALDFEH